MKELSIEQKAQAYDDAKARMNRAYNDNRCTIGFMNEIFPELKESEDERIKKSLIILLQHFCNGYRVPGLDFPVSYKDMLAWLEAQGEQKPVDKKQKFKVGDILVNKKGYTRQVVDIKDNCYYCTREECCDDYPWYGVIPYVDRCWHLWTIQDAKDGDVLVDKDNNIGIYKEIEGICWDSYIYLGCDGKLRGFSIGGSHIQSNTYPATKEQRDLLFQKMREAGYTFDFEKKELKKIEQKPTIWSEEDEDYYDAIISKLEVTQDDALLTDNQMKFLKSLKDRVQPQQKQEWSEVDEYYLDSCITKIELDIQDWEGHGKTMIDVDNEIISWLKSLKDRYTWKPSNEQMEGIECTIKTLRYQLNAGDNRLDSLYNDLKKLREK